MKNSSPKFPLQHLPLQKTTDLNLAEYFGVYLHDLK